MQPDSFAPWLQQQLARLNWSAAEFSKRSYGVVSPGQASVYLRGIHSPGRRKAVLIARILKAELPPLYRPWHRFYPKQQS